MGKRLKDARLDLGLSQEELGKLVGVSKVSISGYEKGRKTPNLKTFLKLIEVLNINIDYALGQELIIKEEKEEYILKLSSIDINIINEIKQNKYVYNKFIDNPKRTVQLIEMKLRD
jgi:transcriptional regulator with XRE-family HTH domain